MFPFVMNSLFNRINYAPDAGDGGGGSGDAGTGGDAGSQTQNQGEGEEQKQQGNNGKDNVDTFEDLWQPSEDGGEEKPPQEQTPEKKPVGDAFIKDYVGKINFTDGVDASKIYEGLSTGDPAALNAALSQVAQNTFKRALIDTNKLITSRVNAAVEQAVSKSRSNVHGDLAVQSMNVEMPFTKNAAIEPIAKAVLAQFMKKGQDAPSAIANVKKFFQRTHQISSKYLGINKPPKGTGRIRNTTPGNENDCNDFEDIDRMKTLSVCSTKLTNGEKTNGGQGRFCI